jgi:hypothetical protein
MGCHKKINYTSKYKAVFCDKLSNRYNKPFHQDLFMTQRISFHQDFILTQYGVYLQLPSPSNPSPVKGGGDFKSSMAYSL